MTEEAKAVKKRAHGIETQNTILNAAGRVFARMAYSDARLKDISDEGGFSQGSIYFHFGNKDDVAHAVLTAQQERMHAVLEESIKESDEASEQLKMLFRGLARLIADDPLVQGGTRLSMQPIAELEQLSKTPYWGWVDTARSLISKGLEDGSVHESVDSIRTAELLNELFIGAQVLSGIDDAWHSLPARVERQISLVELILTRGGV